MVCGRGSMTTASRAGSCLSIIQAPMYCKGLLFCSRTASCHGLPGTRHRSPEEKLKMLPGRTAKRRRTGGPEGPAGDARDPTLRIALALHEEHGIVFDEVVATFNALGRDSRGRTTLEEIDALSEGRRFCATMNASVSLRRIFSRLGDFVPRGDTVKDDDEGAAAGRGGGCLLYTSPSPRDS